MDNILCDELLQEIFHKLPSSSSSSVSLVSKRWLLLFRSSRTSLSLSLPPHFSLLHHLPSLSSFLSHHSSLSSLSLSSPSFASHHHLLLSLLSSNLRSLSLSLSRFPPSLSSLASLSTTCPLLTSLSISLSRPLSLTWLPCFPCLKDLSIVLSDAGSEIPDETQDSDAELKLESLCLVGIRGDDYQLGYLWRNCKNLKKLKLQNCQGIGASFSAFVHCLHNLREVELRTCRSVVDGVLLELAEHCFYLETLLVHDGGSREGLLHFFSQCKSKLLKLDLRLPMDLNNHHLSAVAANFRGLSNLKLQSCCLVTGEGLKALGIAMSGLQELSLVNCDVVEREPGLLANLGQNLRGLRKLDLSHNEMLIDKELVSMLVSCVNLIDLRVRGCKGLTGVAVVGMVRSCKRLENVDIVQCFGIESEAVEILVKNSSRLRRMVVEESKLSDAAKIWASNKFVQVIG